LPGAAGHKELSVGCGCGERPEKAERACRKPRSRLCRIWKILTSEKTPCGDPCVVVPGHVIRKPDPCIYDQFLLMQLGQPVTWDNPDVRIFLNGVEQDTYNLTVSTEYDVEITVHNSSRDKTADGTSVDVRWIEFGAGGQVRHPISTIPADVPVWPGTAVVSTKWKTPGTPGHYCIEVELVHSNDGNPSNNRGWNNTQVYAAHSPVDTTVRVHNLYPRGCPEVKEGGGPWVRPHRVFLGWGLLGATGGPLLHESIPDRVPLVLAVLGLIGAGYLVLSAAGLAVESAYTSMQRRKREQEGHKARTDRVDCNLVELKVDSYDFDDRTGKDFDPDAAFEGRPPVWPATLTPPSFAFVPGEAFRDVDLHVDAPDTPGLTGHFNVSVWQGGVPSGGVTIAITTGG
jgi:hypothetical protein